MLSGMYQFNYPTQVVELQWTPMLYASPLLTKGGDMDVTYAQLQDAHKTRLEAERGSVSTQLLRNHQSTLC